MLKNHFNFKYFIISFLIGISFVYFFNPKKEIIYRFPNPQNVDDLIYRDKNDQCYKYKAEEVRCNGDEKEQPLHPEGYR
jgi:hypothetical protein